MSVASVQHRSLADILLKEGVINEEQYQRALQEYDRTSRSLVRIFTDMELLPDETRIKVLRKATGCEYMKLHDVIPASEVSGYVDRDMCRRAHAVPVRIDGGTVTVAMEDPSDVRTIGDLEKIFGRTVRPVLASAEDIENTIRRMPEPVGADSIDDRPSIGFRLFSSLMLAIIVFGPLVAFYFYANMTSGGKELFASLALTKFEIVLLYVVTWSSWAAVGYFLHDLVFGRQTT